MKKTLPLMIGVGLALGAAAIANAQVSSARTQTNQDSKGVLEEIVVTAQKRAERIQDVPISISVLSGEDLDRSSFSGVSAALSTIPGVATLESYLGGDTQVIVRGVPSSAHFNGASPIAYYLDSVPFGLIKSGLAPDANPYDLKQLEVLRGPQGTLYGASALNGVVRVLTSDADLDRYEFKARLSGSVTSGGSDNYRSDAAVNVPIIQGKLAARAIVGYQEDGGWIDAPNKNNVNDARLGNYRLKLNAQPTENLSIGLSGWASRRTFGAPNASQPDQSKTTPQDEAIHNDWDAYGMKVGYQFPYLTVTSSSGYLDYENANFLDISQQIGLPGGAFTALFTSESANVFAEELSLTSNTQGAWRWSVGGMYRRATEKLVQSIEDLFAIRFNNLSKSYAAYGELTRLFLDDRLEVTVGLRHFHDDHSQDNQNVPDPIVLASSTASANTKRAVVSWHSSEQLMMYGSYSEGFRSGFPQSINTPAGFPPLRPDKLKNYELGAKGSWLDGRVSYDTAVYYMDWLGVQQAVGVPFQNTYASGFINGKSASGFGVDLSLSARPTQNLTLGVSASWNELAQDSTITSCTAPGSCYDVFERGDRLVSSPENIAGAWVNYGLPFSNGYKARVALSANYMSEMQTRFPLATVLVSTGDRMATGRASIAIESPSRWVVTLYADNITNEQDTPVRTPWSDFDARVMPRTVGLQFEYR